jgi:hypothetical protein
VYTKRGEVLGFLECSKSFVFFNTLTAEEDGAKLRFCQVNDTTDRRIVNVGSAVYQLHSMLRHAAVNNL